MESGVRFRSSKYSVTASCNFQFPMPQSAHREMSAVPICFPDARVRRVASSRGCAVFARLAFNTTSHQHYSAVTMISPTIELLSSIATRRDMIDCKSTLNPSKQSTFPAVNHHLYRQANDSVSSIVTLVALPIDGVSEDIWAALNCEVLRADGGGAGMRGRGKREIPEKNPPTSGIVRHDPHLRKSGDPAGDTQVKDLPRAITYYKCYRQHYVINGCVIASAGCIQRFDKQPQYTEVNPNEDAILACKVLNKKGTCYWQKDNKATVDQEVISSRLPKWRTGFDSGAGSLLHLHTSESCLRTMPLVGGFFFSRGPPVSSAPAFRRCSISASSHTHAPNNYTPLHCLGAFPRHAIFSSLFAIRLNFTVLYIPEPEPSLHWLLRRCEATPFLTELQAMPCARDILEHVQADMIRLAICALKFLGAKRVQSPAGSPRIFACGNRAGRRRWSSGFLGVLQFPPPCHYGAAPYSLRFILIGSQDLPIKRHPNLFTHSLCNATKLQEFILKHNTRDYLIKFPKMLVIDGRTARQFSAAESVIDARDRRQDCAPVQCC
ncbi:hypothetical protein PR048_033260 [Dryococelus australis]|uniref:Uncharacterized protein n=1 Tax=Dryococelus australis TaxID=614101 RepID=A0ABQ9G401_9NEOP|nr:hypothetical protein PR048_033260 [Dryococelus australis]